MPQIKSNIKSMEKDAARHAANSRVKSSVHTAIRRTTEAIAAGDADEVERAFDKASSVIDSAAQKGVLHKNNAARKKSRLAAKVNAMGKESNRTTRPAGYDGSCFICPRRHIMLFPTFLQFKHFFVLFFPLLFTQIAQISTSIFSSIFSGQAGTVDLAGVAVAVNIWIPIFSGICGLFFGVSPIIAQLRGAEKNSRIPMYITQSIYIAVFFTVVCVAAGYLCLPAFLDFMNLEPAVHQIAGEYLIALSLGILPLFLLATLRYVVDAHGMTHISMAILIIDMLLTIALFRLLIFGGLGIAPMGGVGTGYAITIASWIAFFIFAAVIQLKAPFRSYHIWTNLRPFSWIHCRQQLQLGIPIFIAVFCETSLFSIVGLLMAEFGTLYLAANQAAISYATLTYTLPWSVSLTATIVIGYEVGARRYGAARQYAVLCQMTAFTLAALTISSTYLFLDPISSIFTNESDTFNAIRKFLIYAMAFCFFDAAGTPVQGILRGYKDVKIITYIAFVTYWLISIPMGYAFAHATSYGPYGYWFSLVITLIINAGALNYRLWRHTAFQQTKGIE